jgi:DNA-binding transcriptional MerR regulator
MPYKEKRITKLYYSISEVAGMFNVNSSLIRFWESEFDIIKPKKNKRGNRMFTKNDIDNFHLIFNLVKEQGFTLNGAKEKLRNNNKQMRENWEVIKSLKDIKSFLLKLKKEL